MNGDGVQAVRGDTEAALRELCDLVDAALDESQAGLDGLAEVCDAGTKVIVIGHVNDVDLYRDLVRRGVSEYIVAPVETLEIIRSIGELFIDRAAAPLGRSIAFVSWEDVGRGNLWTVSAGGGSPRSSS